MVFVDRGKTYLTFVENLNGVSEFSEEEEQKV